MKTKLLHSFFAVTLILLTAFASGCSTVNGVGKDVEDLGEGIQDAAD